MVESPDGRQAPHPRLLPELFGHEKAEQQLARALAAGRLHPSQLISGSFGIGKASLAYRLAAHLLAGGRGEGDRLSVDPMSQTARWIAAQSHPDLHVLEREVDVKTRKRKGEISVDAARRLLEFFSHTAGNKGWRVAIVDTADDLNIASANALLKLIEEPPARSLLLLVCHQPGRLLRTIRSRCLVRDLFPLRDDDLKRALLPAEEAGFNEQALTAAMKHCSGSPGLAWDLLNSEAAATFAALDHAPALTVETIIEIGNRFSNRQAGGETFDLFCRLLLGWLARRTRAAEGSAQAASFAEAYAGIERSIADTNALNLDRRQTVIAALSRIATAARSTTA